MLHEKNQNRRLLQETRVTRQYFLLSMSHSKQAKRIPIPWTIYVLRACPCPFAPASHSLIPFLNSLQFDVLGERNAGKFFDSPFWCFAQPVTAGACFAELSPGCQRPALQKTPFSRRGYTELAFSDIKRRLFLFLTILSHHEKQLPRVERVM